MSTLSELYKQNTTAKGTTQSSLSVNTLSKQEDTDFWDDAARFGQGIGYLGEKAAVGFVSSIEGIWDFTASGIAKLFGADDWAEEQIANDWFGDWYSHPDEWFQPTGGWKVAGDVASGIGTSLPAMAAVGVGAGIAALSGGTLAPAAIGLISAGVAGLGAAGRGVKEAYEQTGQLGGKEYLYGAGVGVVEGGIEGVTDALGLGGVGSVIKNFGKSATKSMASRVGVAMVDGFVGEAFEEGFSELVTPYIKKMTYDPNAKNATAQEILYASLVGGLSGAIMGGGGAAVDVSSSLISGTKALNNGRQAEIMEYSKYATEYEDTQHTGEESFERISSTYKALEESLAKTGGEITTANQRMMLGDLSRADIESVIAPKMYQEAANILNNVEAYVERLNSYNFTDTDGKPIRYTVEQITEGFDRNNPKSIKEAIKANETLRTLSAMSLAGKMMADTSAMTDSILRGEKLANQVDLNYLAERGSTEEINALSEALGITDWSTAEVEDVNRAVKAYAERGGIDEYMSHKKVVDKIKQVKNKKSVPKGLAGLKDGGAVRYSDGTLDIGIAQEGDKYIMYDFNRNIQSRVMTHEEVNTYLREYSNSKNSSAKTNEQTGEHIPKGARASLNIITTERKVIDLSNDNKLSDLVHGVHGSKRYNIIREYILVELQDQPIRMSDGKEAVVDRSDAQHIARNAGDKKTAEISHIKEIVESAKLVAEESSTKEGKFNYFWYYEAFVKYGKDTIPVYVNVGRANNDATYHIYDITQKIRDTAHRVNDVERPKPNEGYALENGISNNNIPQPSEKINPSGEKTSMLVEEIDTFARENISDYAGLSASNKSMVRKVIRQARANGLGEADVMSYARVSAHSGLDIVFSKKLCHKEGDVYYAGYFDPNGNRIVVNPEAKKKHSAILIHELSHAIRSYKGIDNKIHYIADIDAVMRISDDTWSMIESAYADQKIDVSREELIADEASAYYAEQMLGTDGVVDLLLGKKPSLKKKILDFFKGAEKDYEGDARLSREARKQYKSFKQMFDAFSALNQGSNAYGGNTESGVRYSLNYTTDNRPVAVIKDDIFNGEFDNITDSERLKRVKKEIKKFRPGIPISGRLIHISGKTAGHFTNSDYTDKIRNKNVKVYEDKLNISQNIDDVIYASTDYINEELKHQRDDNIIEFARGKVLLQIGKNKYEANVLVGYTTMNEMLLYDIQDLSPTTFTLKQKKAQPKLAGKKSYTKKTVVPSNSSIPQTPEKSTPSTKKDVEANLPEGARAAYDFTKPFEDQVDDYKNNLIPKNESLLLGKTPEVWLRVGFNPLPVTVNQTHVDYALNGTKDFNHHMGELILKKLPEAIKEPVAIIHSQSAQAPDRAVVVLKIPHNGSNIICAVEVDGYGTINNIDINSNAITSTYAKTNILRQLNKAVNDTVNGKVELFYWDKKEALTLMQHAGLQLPGTLPQGGFVHSIHDKGSLVKSKIQNITETVQFIRWFGDWRKGTKGSSKVVNTDGTPMIVYHGSDVKDIDVFKTTNANGTGGLYLTTNRRVAEAFAGKYGKVYESYVNLRNPFILDAHNNYFDSIPTPKSMQGSQYAFGGNTVDTNAIAAFARSKGYDGVIIKNIQEPSGFGDDIIVFEPNQVKSATENIGTFSKDTDKYRYSLDISSIREQTKGKVLTEMPERYKPKIKDKAFSGWTSLQISLTNEQAGIEKIGKKLGIKDIEARVQTARAAINQAQEMVGGNQYRIGSEGKEYQGDGLAKIFEPIEKAGDTEDFNTYLLHWHNTSRMSLEERSRAEIAAAQGKYDAEKKKLDSVTKKIKKLIKERDAENADKKAINKTLKAERAKLTSLRKSVNELQKQLTELTVEENKPIFIVEENGKDRAVTADESRAIIAEMDKEHPEFKAVAEKVWAYNRNLNQYRVDTGLISQEDFDYLNKKYPHYVPTYRDGGAKGITPITGNNSIAVKTTVKTAKGSGAAVLPIKTIIARQTMETIRAGRINQLAKAMYDASGVENDYIAEVSREKNTDLEVNPTDVRPKDNQITFFENGEKVTLAVSSEIFAGFDAFHGSSISDSVLFKVMNWINNTFKRLVTGWSPAFMIRNPIRDIQDAGIYTKYGKSFAKNYARAGKLITSNSEEWQLYRAMGGLSASLFNYDTGTQNSQNKWGFTKEEGKFLKKTANAIENANMFVEQLPRFAEFLSAIEAGVSPEQAILDAADVTTNFGRTGKITKILNSTVIPFLNPSIQGFSKMIRSVTSIRTAREAGALFIKAALIGIVPMALNMLMYGDDDDYKDLRDNDKENNFLIKVGDTFIKLPRGRVASALGGLVNRTTKAANGEDADWAGYLENVSQQVTPVDSMSRTIISPFTDVATNTTWYGTAIEGRQFENVAPKDRYDESTSEIAKVIGQVINYSPKKIHYLLDQYTGVIGDFILPLTTKRAEKDFFSGNFTLDPAASNKLSTDFYKLYDEAQYAKSAGNDVATYQVKYLNSVKSAVNELFKEKSAIQNSDLSSAEKLQQTRVIQVLINEAYKTALNDYELYTKAFETTASITDEKLRYTESIRLTHGAERAFKEYDKDVYEKYSLIAQSGISYDELYYYYFSLKQIESDKDEDGNTIAGSKKQKVLELINSLNISKDQKMLLLAASGYTVGDKSTKQKLARYITSLSKVSKDDKTALAELCGYKVVNGTILLSSIK